MKKGIIFLFLVLILSFVNLAMTSSIKSDSSINIEKAVYEKLEKQEEQIDKIVSDILNILRILESKGESGKKVVKIFAIPNEVEIYKNKI